MALHPLAGKPAPQEMLVNIPKLVADYYTRKPDPENPAQKVSFGTSGHRGTSSCNGFTEDHILAIAQAICEYREAEGISGPLFLGKDTHALSEAAQITAIEVFAGNAVSFRVQSGFGYTPTPVISNAILCFNSGKKSGFADGVVITPSHNPPQDGGLKYNPPSGGPADTNITGRIQDRANEIIRGGLKDVKRVPIERALRENPDHDHDYVMPYVRGLDGVIDMAALAKAGLKIGADPMGGAGIHYWEPIAETYGLDIEVINKAVDPTFSFMTVDKDGKIRMDCSSPFAMASLVELKDRYDIAFGNDPDYDRHGIVTRSVGLMNPNHYLAVAIAYLYPNRSGWNKNAAVGKTLVASSMIDRVTKDLGRELYEVPVGFKWFVDGLQSGNCGFGGEESAGASFLAKNGEAWSTDKDGIIMDLLAAEITATTGKDPGEHYLDLEARFGKPYYERIDAVANREQKEVLKNLSPEMVETKELAGETITAKLTNAPGNNAPIGGLKVVTENGWFTARPSGTEDIYKVYAESFQSAEHLAAIQKEAQEIVDAVLQSAVT